jgi:putative nucleotidyltransferase with HDIG domain
MIKREKAMGILRTHVKGKFLFNHHLCVEATMRAFARHFGEDENLWGICGLLHDLDWEITESDVSKHTFVTAEILRAAGVDEIVIKAIAAHAPWISGVNPESMLEKCLYSTEELTGLIVACALVRESKKIADVSADSVMKKLRDKGFARGVDREIVGKAPEMLGMTMEEIVQIMLEAMKKIAEEIGL